MTKCIRMCTLLLGAAVLALAACLPAGVQARTPKHRGAEKHHHRPSPHRPSSSFLRGITINNELPQAQVEKEITEAHALHAQVVRIQASWSALEPNGPNQIAPEPLSNVDNVVEAAAKYGMRVILLVQSTPCWASSAPPSIESTCVPGQSGDANAWPPVNPSDFGTFVAYLVQRYGAALAALEIWNEPD